MLVADISGSEVIINLSDNEYEVIWRGRVENHHGGAFVDCSERGDLVKTKNLGTVSGIGYLLSVSSPELAIRRQVNIRCSNPGGPIQYLDPPPVQVIQGR